MRTSIPTCFTFRRTGLSSKVSAAFALLCIAAFGLAPSVACAQGGINSDGRDFYIGFMPGIPHQSSPFTNTKENDYILIGSYQDNNQVTISYFNGTGNPVVGKTLIVNKGMCVQVPVDHASMFPTRPGEMLEYKAANIHSDYPVSVQFYSDGSSSGSMYQAIPTSALGKSYVVAAFNDNPLKNNPGSINRDSSSSEFMIIAAYPNTTVTFTPNSTTFSGITGVNSGAGSDGSPHPVTITMQQGQIYWVRSNPQDISDDMSGSTVVSDKPVAVLGGEERALIGDPTGFWTSLDNDIRDMVVEQMTPVADWGTDYPSIPTMPVTSSFADDETVAGDGDMYRVYTNDPNGMAMDNWQEDPTYGATLYGPNSVNLYQSPAEEFPNIMNPVDLVTDPNSLDAAKNLKKFYAVEYQYFQGHHDWNPNRGTEQGKGATPLNGGGGDTVEDETSGRSANEMDLVPIDRYRLSTVFMVPSNSWYKGYQFITVITNKDSIRNILITKNNSSTGNLQSYTVRQYQIPTHPELIGLTLKMPAGSYVITGNTPFACYSYGRTETVYKDIWGYAAPTGQAYGTHDQSNTMKADIIPTCGDWDVRVHESIGKNPGIADVMLLNDPSGFYARPARVSYNCRLNGSGTIPTDPTSPPFIAGDTSLEFQVQVDDPSKDAYAAIYVVDVSGNDTVIELYYKAPQVALSANRIRLADTVVGANICSSFTIHVGSTGNYPSIQMPPAVLKSTDTSNIFTISSNPVLPANLIAGDSVVFSVCYTAVDTNLHTDSVQLIAGCVDTTLIVQGRGRTPIIYAHDWDFGNVPIGDTTCKDIVVQNIGNWPLILDNNYFLHANPDYTFNGSIPVTILPGKQQTLNFCFHPAAKGPSDSRMDWGTNLTGLYAHHNKDTTQLLGYGISPGMNWDRHNQPFSVICQDSQIIRVYLINPSSGPTGENINVTNIQVIGDVSEFSIVDFQNGGNGVPLTLDKDSSMFVDLKFTPNLGMGYNASRIAEIVASGLDNANHNYTDTLVCAGFVHHAIVTINPQSFNFGDLDPNTQLTQTFTITNTGDAPFVYAGLNLTGADFTILSGPQLGDTLQIGATDTIVLQFTAKPSGGQSSAILNATYDLCSFVSDTVQGSSSIVRVAEVTPSYPITYICHNDTDFVSASNTGTLGVFLDRVQIIDSSGLTPASSQFAFVSTNSQLINPNINLPSDSTVTFPVLYTPSAFGSVAAEAVFYWEDTSKGQTRFFQEIKPITGTGYQAANTLSLRPAAPDTQYTAVTANQVSIPVQMLLPFDSIAQVYGMQFTVRYYRDVFEDPSVTAVSGLSLTSAPTTMVDPTDNKYELLTIHLGSTSPIEASGAVATLNLKYVVAKDSVSPFQVQDLVFLDKTGAQACWVAPNAEPTTFFGTNLCGDATLREYLKGGMPAFSIGQIAPNPVTETANVDFFVAQDGVPMTMQVFNALGQPVQTLMSNEPHPKGGYRVSIDASELPSGLYTIFLSTPGFGVSKQVVVTR